MSNKQCHIVNHACKSKASSVFCPSVAVRAVHSSAPVVSRIGSVAKTFQYPDKTAKRVSIRMHAGRRACLSPMLFFSPQIRQARGRRRRRLLSTAATGVKSEIVCVVGISSEKKSVCSETWNLERTDDESAGHLLRQRMNSGE